MPTTQRAGGPFSKLKVALVSDELTRAALARECRVMNVTPLNHRAVLSLWRPDILFVEATWKGPRNAWRYKVASYADHPERTNAALARVVRAARARGVPSLFWNREDGVHFDRFIASARLFDHVLTVDETVLPRYRAALGPEARLGTMMFAVTPHLHFATGEPTSDPRALFVGSYGTHVHDARRVWQDRAFRAARPLGLAVVDRNSDRKPAHYRYPDHPWIETRGAVPYGATGALYRAHAVHLNVNTVVDSTTMFSRRLVELLACGAVTLTNRSRAVEAMFADYCTATDDETEMTAFFERIARDGPSPEERERAMAGSRHVLEHHTWRRRLEQVLDFIR